MAQAQAQLTARTLAELKQENKNEYELLIGLARYTTNTGANPRLKSRIERKLVHLTENERLDMFDESVVAAQQAQGMFFFLFVLFVCLCVLPFFYKVFLCIDI